MRKPVQDEQRPTWQESGWVFRVTIAWGMYYGSIVGAVVFAIGARIYLHVGHPWFALAAVGMVFGFMMVSIAFSGPVRPMDEAQPWPESQVSAQKRLLAHRTVLLFRAYYVAMIASIVLIALGCARRLDLVLLLSGVGLTLVALVTLLAAFLCGTKAWGWR